MMKCLKNICLNKNFYKYIAQFTISNFVKGIMNSIDKDSGSDSESAFDCESSGSFINTVTQQPLIELEIFQTQRFSNQLLKFPVTIQSSDATQSAQRTYTPIINLHEPLRSFSNPYLDSQLSASAKYARKIVCLRPKEIKTNQSTSKCKCSSVTSVQREALSEMAGTVLHKQEVPNSKKGKTVALPAVEQEAWTVECGPPDVDISPELECSICLTTIELYELKYLPCTHAFHQKCINKWLRIKRKCPLCRLYVVRPRRQSGYRTNDWRYPEEWAQSNVRWPYNDRRNYDGRWYNDDRRYPGDRRNPNERRHTYGRRNPNNRGGHSYRY